MFRYLEEKNWEYRKFSYLSLFRSSLSKMIALGKSRN